MQLLCKQHTEKFIFFMGKRKKNCNCRNPNTFFTSIATLKSAPLMNDKSITEAMV